MGLKRQTPVYDKKERIEERIIIADLELTSETFILLEDQDHMAGYLQIGQLSSPGTLP